MTRICCICARQNSKGVKDKNIRLLLDKPLIAYSIIQAKESQLFDCVVVSSDSERILKIAKEWGTDYLIKRSPKLSTDSSPKLPVIQDCLIKAEELSRKRYDIIVDLDVTAPLRKIEDIVNTVEMLENNRVSNVITGVPARSSPYFNLVELNEDGFVQLSKISKTQIVRRQDAPKCYDLNASVYAWMRDGLLMDSSDYREDTMLYVMADENSIGIDSELDFQFVEFLMKKRMGVL